MAEEWVNKLEERQEGKYTEQSIEGKKENTEWKQDPKLHTVNII